LEAVRRYAAPLNLNLEVHDLAQLWQEAWHQLAAKLQGREVEFCADTGDLDTRCRVDLFPIERVFRNILENSLAACPDPAQITITCSPTELNGQSAVRLRFSDNGVGLTAEQRQRIFEPFYTTKTMGTGLGMAIARRIVLAHGGQISVADDPPPGATVEVILPRGQS
jgi:signal transduction histidine kinase